MTDLTSAIQHLLNAKRISAASQSYAKDNPTEWDKVQKYLTGGSRPTGVTTEMGLGLVEVEDVRRNVSPPPPPPSGNYLLDEQWASIDPSRWQKKWWFNGDTYYHDQTEELQVWRDANAFVSGGNLTLRAKREDVTDFQGRARKFTSGILQTNGIQGVTPTPGPSYTYGKFEARIKAAPGLGMWNCFWLCDAGWPSNCPREIDVVEIVGANPNRANFNFHVNDLGGGGGFAYTHSENLDVNFHTYAVEWRQNFIAWSFDGVEKYRYTGPNIPTNPHYLILNLQIGGSGTWAGTPDPNTFTQSDMIVDWVRVAA